MNNINNARLNAMREAYENAYDNIYTFSACSDGSISLMPYISKNSPIRNDVVVCDSYTEALRVVRQFKDKTTVKQAIGFVEALIKHYNLDEEVAVHTPDSMDYDALMNCLDIHPDYSVYNATAKGEVSILYYEDKISAILIDDASVDDILGAIMDLNWALKINKRL